MRLIKFYFIFLIAPFLLLPLKEGRAHISFGSFTPALLKYQVDSFGSTNILDLNLMLGVHLNIPLTFKPLKSHFFRPEIGIIFESSEMDDEYFRSTTYLLYDFAWEFRKNTFLRYGLGTFIDKVGGIGGSKIQNNGSSYATFYRPMTTIYSYTSSINIGIEYELTYRGLPLESKRYRPLIRFETFTFSPLNSKRRAFALSINMLFLPKKGLFYD